jgi:hypothetical protein
MSHDIVEGKTLPDRSTRIELNNIVVEKQSSEESNEKCKKNKKTKAGDAFSMPVFSCPLQTRGYPAEAHRP